MPPRFDERNLTLDLAVADLLDAQLRRNLGFANRGGYERLWLGQAIHSRYQERALAEDPAYRREVPVSLELEHRGWRVRIDGRIDGLRGSAEGVRVVEEIKSVRRGGQLSAAAREIYERQALIYAWMLHRGGEERVEAELVLIEIGTEEVEREPLEIDFQALEALVKKRLNSLLYAFESGRAAAAERRAAAARLRFPYPELRRGQRRIMDGVAAALEARGHLLVEAPTGIGKTVAALLPALRHALEAEKRVFVLTAKTLQQEMATAVLETLNPDGAFHSLRLRAKAKMCANDEVLCHEEFCPYARDYYLKLHRSRVVQRLLGRAGTLLPDEIYAAARGEEVCPFEVSLELSSQVQFVVCDYNYAFDPYVSLSDFGQDGDLDDVILVIDEIHNLVGRGRGYYSPHLSARQAEEAAAALAAGGTPLHYRTGALCHRLAALVSDSVRRGLEEAGGGARAAEAPQPEDDLWALRPDFDEAFVDYIEHQRETSTYRAEDPFVGLYFDFLRYLNVLLVATGEAFSHCVEVVEGDPRLQVLCKDPSRFLGAVINRAHSVVGLSATLSPPEFYRDLLGFDRERTSVLSLPSPFPEENRRLVIDDSVATTWRQREENYQPIADRLAALVEGVPGNCLALFPSYRFLDEVARRLRVRGRRVIVQTRDSSDRARVETLEALRSPLAGDVLLLAVAGGVFAEGVDYPGQMLRAVAVVGPCLPAVTLEQALLKAYYQERFERGFEYAFVVPGMTRVVQAAGRLIRSADDTGVIALLDRRFLASPYREHLPEHWLPPEGPEALVGDPGEAARGFFSGHAPGSAARLTDSG